MRVVSCTVALGVIVGLGVLNGCEEMKENPRTTGTIAGAAGGAAIGAVVDRNHPAEGAIIGGVVGGAAGNVAGKVYKDSDDDD